MPRPRHAAARAPIPSGSVVIAFSQLTPQHQAFVLKLVGITVTVVVLGAFGLYGYLKINGLPTPDLLAAIIGALIIVIKDFFSLIAVETSPSQTDRRRPTQP